MSKRHPYTTWSLALVKLPHEGLDEAQVYTKMGAAKGSQCGGFWIVDDCDELVRQFCEDEMPEVPKGNRFHRRATES